MKNMPIYEFKCEVCSFSFEAFQKLGEEYPLCPRCQAKEVIKLPSLFAYQDRSVKIAERERSILKRTRDYLIDGKVKEAQNFLNKAKDYYPTDTIKKLSDTLAEKGAVRVHNVLQNQIVVTKKRGEK